VLEDGSDFVGDYASSLKRAKLGAARFWDNDQVVEIRLSPYYAEAYQPTWAQMRSKAQAGSTWRSLGELGRVNIHFTVGEQPRWFAV
jgi:hypothetical protein